MTGKLNTQIALAILGGLDRNATGRKSVFEASGSNAVFAEVAGPPNIREISILEMGARGNFAAGNVGSAKSELEGFGGNAQSGKAYFAVPAGELLSSMVLLGQL